jgi:putative oxidoreductase
MELPWLSRWQPQLLAVLRIVTGLLFLEHGTAKLFGFPLFPEGMPHPLPTLIVVSAVIELLCGLLVTLGLFTRLAAFIASGEMAIGYFMVHFPKSFWPIANMGEGAILYCFIFLYLAAAGAGAWSIDGARLRNAPIR